MKSKGLVIAGIVLLIISLVFVAYFAPIYNQASINAADFEISGIDPDQAVPLIVYWSGTARKRLYLNNH